MEKLRMSHYTIPVKIEAEEGKYLLLHGYTGAIDIVSEKLLAKIRNISSENDISESTLRTLVSRGYITTKTIEEEYAYVARMAKALHRKCDILYATFTWIVTYNCNFRCPYCFEGRDKKDSERKIVFIKEQVDIAYNALDWIQPHKELRKNVITLYGGEPLLAENRNIVNYIVEEGKKHGYTFVAVTNGYEIEHFTDLLAPDGIYKLQITIDGTKDIHNQRRVHYKGYETFDKIVSNIQLALNRDVKVVVRMNSDGCNIEQFTELKNYFEKKGFFNYPQFEIYTAILKDNEYVTEQGHDAINFLSPQSFLEKQKEQDNSYDSGTSICRNVYKALSEKVPLKLKSISCAAQVNGYVFDPLGGIYPCWEVIGNKEHLEGRYSQTGITWYQPVIDKWKKTDVSQKKTCNKCRYALLCGGGCPYHHIQRKNLSCSLFQKTFDIYVNKVYAEFKNNV